jgi:hypothetical protein
MFRRGGLWRIQLWPGLAAAALPGHGKLADVVGGDLRPLLAHEGGVAAGHHHVQPAVPTGGDSHAARAEQESVARRGLTTQIMIEVQCCGSAFSFSGSAFISCYSGYKLKREQVQNILIINK